MVDLIYLVVAGNVSLASHMTYVTASPRNNKRCFSSSNKDMLYVSCLKVCASAVAMIIVVVFPLLHSSVITGPKASLVPVSRRD